MKYILNPSFIKSEKIEWALFLKLLVLYYLISVPLGLIVGLLIRILNFYETDINFNPLKLLFVGIILGPIIEEMLFRFLLLPRYKNIVIFFGFSVCMAIMLLIRESTLFSIIFLIFGIVSFIILLNNKYVRKTQKFFLNWFRYIFYISCILFGFYHITNYLPVTYKLILFMPIIVLPQMIIGAFLGYIRMKFGIIYSILFHSVTNIFPIFILLIDK